MRLDGTSALVTGGSSGLGKAVCARLRQEGAQVVVFSRDRLRGEAAAREVDGIWAGGDVLNEEATLRALDIATDRAPLRSVVLCAGIGHAQRLVDREASVPGAHGLTEFRQVVETNLVGAFNTLRLAATVMAGQKPQSEGQRGAIVAASSQAARIGQVGQTAYAASKAGLEGLLLPAARDLGAHGIRVNAIRPTGFDTPMFGPDGVSAELAERLSAAAAFPRRVGRPAEFAALAVELLTNDFINATVVDLHAGMADLPR